MVRSCGGSKGRGQSLPMWMHESGGATKKAMTDSSESEDGLPSFNLKGILSGKQIFDAVCNCFHLHLQALIIPEP